MLRPREGRLARDALLRRRLASVDLPEGDDGRRARRLGRDHRLARVAARARGDRRGSRAARRRARSAAGRGDLLGSLPRDAPEPGLDHREGARGHRERAARHQGEGARRAGVRALRRADARDDPDVLVALRHDARARVRGDRDAEARLLRGRRRARARGRRAGYAAFKTNVVVPGDDPRGAHAGVRRGGRHAARGRDRGRARPAARGVRGRDEGRARPIVDLNFNLEPEGCVRVAKALEPFDLLWLEVDLFDPGALAHVRHVAPMPICSGENLYGSRDFRPYLEAGGMDVASVDVIWNGFHQAKKIADLAETFEVNCAPHNYYSPPRDVHRRAVVRRDPECAHPRVRRRRRSLARRARDGAAGDLRRRAAHPVRAGVGRRAERGRARASTPGRWRDRAADS